MSSRAALPPVPFVGLTGAVAAGKSEALAAFESEGAQTLSSDAVVHELLGTPEVAARLTDRWGPDAAPGGEVDRAKVGEVVFSSPEELSWLERLLHPLVGERIASWRRALPADAPVAVVEVPLLFETSMEDVFDATVAVTASDELRVERAGARGTEQLDGRSARQLSQDDKAARATHVLVNDGSRDELRAAVAALIAELAESGAS